MMKCPRLVFSPAPNIKAVAAMKTQRVKIQLRNGARYSSTVVAELVLGLQQAAAPVQGTVAKSRSRFRSSFSVSAQ